MTSIPNLHTGLMTSLDTKLATRSFPTNNSTPSNHSNSETVCGPSCWSAIDSRCCQDRKCRHAMSHASRRVACVNYSCCLNPVNPVNTAPTRPLSPPSRPPRCVQGALGSSQRQQSTDCPVTPDPRLADGVTRRCRRRLDDEVDFRPSQLLPLLLSKKLTREWNIMHATLLMT